MKILIVYAHPEPKSFNGAMKDLAVATLRGAGHQVVVSDLYAQNFGAVLGADDFRGPRLADDQQGVKRGVQSHFVGLKSGEIHNGRSVRPRYDLAPVLCGSRPDPWPFFLAWSTLFLMWEEDVFSLNRARQMAALLDRDPADLRLGGMLPRGWHSAMFAQATPQANLNPDGSAGLGVTLPPTDLTRLMFGGRRVGFAGDIAIGAPARRMTKLVSATPKTGRSGRLLIVTVQRDIFCDGADPVVTEQQDYVLREAADAPRSAASLPPERPVSDASKDFVADERMLLRYCALTFNTHRIHYDHPYATQVEGYPALVVNGNLISLMLTEFFRAIAAREPVSLVTRNIRPLFCGHTNTLHARRGDIFRIWAADAGGHAALEADIA